MDGMSQISSAVEKPEPTFFITQIAILLWATNNAEDEELSLSDNIDPPDDFEVLLDAALVAHPDLNTVVADWDVLHTFWQVINLFISFFSLG